MNFMCEFPSSNLNLLSAGDLEAKLDNYDPDIAFLCPGNVKSAVWNKFRMIFYKGEKQHFVICYKCYLILSFRSRAGTSGLLRHRCNFQRTGYVTKQHDDNFKAMLLRDITPSTSTGQHSIFYMPVEVNDIKEEYNGDEYYEQHGEDDEYFDEEHSNLASMLDVDFNESPDSEPAQTKLDATQTQPNIQLKFDQVGSLLKMTQQPTANPELLVKEELEYKINNNDPDVSYRKHNSNVSTWARYMPIYYKHVKQNYVRCLECGWLVLHKTSTGTGSLLRHKCKLKLPQSEAQKITVQAAKPEAKVTKSFMKMHSIMHQSVIDDIHKKQAKFLFKETRTADIFNDEHFKTFAQSLINIGCYYGQQDVSFLADAEALVTKTMPALYLETKTELEQTLLKTNLCYSYNIWHNHVESKEYLTINSYSIDSEYNFKKVYVRTIPWKSEVNLAQIFPETVETPSPYLVVVHSPHESITESKDFENIPCIVGILWDLMKYIMEMFEYNIDMYLQKNFFSNNTDEPDYLEKFLAPFKEPIQSLTSETNPTINEVLLWKKKLERSFLVKNEVDDENMTTIKSNFQLKMQSKLKLHDFHKIAVFFDPKFKGLKFLSDDERSEVLKIVKKHLKSNEDSINNLKKQNATNSKFELNENDKFVEFMDISIDVDDEDLADAEIRQYMDVKLETPMNILEYWRNETSFPLLKSLSQKVLNVPACCDEMKLMFGEQGREFKKRISLLNESELDVVLYLNQNCA